MKKYLLATIIVLSGLISGCERMFMDSDATEFSRREIFDSMWKLVDEKYSYLGYKNIDWDALYAKYSDEVTEDMSGYSLYRILYDMLYELKDGHVNLFAGFDYSRNWDWYLGAPANFNYPLVERSYLGTDYWSSGGLKNTLLDEGKYGYIYYPSFSSSAAYIGVVLKRFKDTDGIILDLRDNGGGALSNAEMLADYLADMRRLTYRTKYKKGPGHEDFSEFKDHYSTPKGPGYSKPVVILTNRSCFSATSYFVTMAKEFPNVIVLGDSTGGGGGLPADFILPGGWTIRLSTTRGSDARGVDFENGVAPDEKYDMNTALVDQGIDSMIERAKEIIAVASRD